MARYTKRWGWVSDEAAPRKTDAELRKERADRLLAEVKSNTRDKNGAGRHSAR